MIGFWQSSIFLLNRPFFEKKKNERKKKRAVEFSILLLFYFIPSFISIYFLTKTDVSDPKILMKKYLKCIM